MHDDKLLDMYDLIVEEAANMASVPRQLAKYLYDTEGAKVGNSPEAIEKHIRRLVKTRERAEAARAESERQMRAILEEQEQEHRKRVTELGEKNKRRRRSLVKFKDN